MMTSGGESLTEEHQSHLWLKDIKEDDHVSGLYLAKAKRVGLTKRGDPFLSITLADRTGEVETRVWERAEELSSLFREGDIIDVEGYASTYRNQIQLTLSGLKVSEHGGDPSLFLETTPKDTTEMLGSLRKILKGVKDSHLKDLVDRFLSDGHFITRFKRSPAAKNFHHSYLGGLLEHTLSVCQITQLVTKHYSELDKDILMTGAFLHDIGKIRELRYDLQIDYSDEGRLMGHLVLGVVMVDEKLATLEGFPQELALRLKHLILSHHGQYEFGSPKRPKFLEAFALHLIDDLDAKMNGLGRFMERDQQEGAWTEFNRMFERYFLKSKIPVAEEKTQPKPDGDERQKTLFSRETR